MKKSVEGTRSPRRTQKCIRRYLTSPATSLQARSAVQTFRLFFVIPVTAASSQWAKISSPPSCTQALTTDLVDRLKRRSSDLSGNNCPSNTQKPTRNAELVKLLINSRITSNTPFPPSLSATQKTEPSAPFQRSRLLTDFPPSSALSESHRAIPTDAMIRDIIDSGRSKRQLKADIQQRQRQPPDEKQHKNLTFQPSACISILCSRDDSRHILSCRSVSAKRSTKLPH